MEKASATTKQEQAMTHRLSMFLAAAVAVSSGSVASAGDDGAAFPAASPAAPAKATAQIPSSTDEARELAALRRADSNASPATQTGVPYRIPSSTDEARAAADAQRAQMVTAPAAPSRFAGRMPTSTDEARGISAPSGIALAIRPERQPVAACPKTCDCRGAI
jgi:hypothetical protein